MSMNRQRPNYLPMLDWLLAYRKEWLQLDVIAGLTTAAVVIPKAMAFATIAGLPVQVAPPVVDLDRAVHAPLAHNWMLQF